MDDGIDDEALLAIDLDRAAKESAWDKTFGAGNFARWNEGGHAPSEHQRGTFSSATFSADPADASRAGAPASGDDARDGPADAAQAVPPPAKSAVAAKSAVKKNKTAYAHFQQAMRSATNASMKKANQDVKVSASDVTKRLAEMWAALDAQKKQEFEALAKADKERYAQELAAERAAAGAPVAPQQPEPPTEPHATAAGAAPPPMASAAGLPAPEAPAAAPPKPPPKAAAKAKPAPATTAKSTAAAAAAPAKKTANKDATAAMPVLREYLMTRNRPYSVLQIFENLRGEFTRPALQSAADVLTASGELCTKAYGKAAIYFPNQAHMPEGIAPEEAKALFDEAEALEVEAHQIENVTLPALHATRRELLSEPTNEELRQEYKDLKGRAREKEELETQLRAGTSGVASVRDDDVRVVERHDGIRERWIDYKKLAYSVLDQICISCDGLNVEDLIDEIGIDTDEANRAVLPPPRKKART